MSIHRECFYAIPTGKSQQTLSATKNIGLVVVPQVGSLLDGEVNAHYSDSQAIVDPTVAPFHALISYLNFPAPPNRELFEFHRESNRRPKKPLAIHPRTGRINLNARSLLKNADPLPQQPESPIKIASGVRLTTIVESLSPKVAALEVEDMNQELFPGNSIVFTTRTRLSPTVPQIKKLRRASADGLSDRTRSYIESHQISEADLDRYAQTLLADGAVSLFINGKVERFNLDTVYSLIKTSSKKKRDAFPQLHFFHAMYSKFLDVVAQKTTQEPVSAQSLIKAMHEQPELGITIPHEINDRLAQEVLAAYSGSTVPIEEMAAVIKKVPVDIIALSPALQLYEVMVASGGYTLYLQDDSPIISDGYDNSEAGDYVATVSAWPDLVVGAVNKGSVTWNTMLDFEREHLAKRNAHVDEAFVQARLEKRLQKLFGRHVLNFHVMKKIDLQILHAFLSGLALDIPETQLILYERKAKLMVEERNNSLAPHSLFDDSTTGIIPTQSVLFKDGMAIEEKNTRLPGIRDSAFAVSQIVQLYENLRQLSSLSGQPHPHLNWRNAISLRGSIIHIPLFRQMVNRSYFYVPGDSYGIEMVDHSRYISNDNMAQVRAQIGRTLAERMVARKKKIKRVRKAPNATPLRVAA